tara:strand:+ start:1836 stop:2222 length:387 start_codon:yes stop_codon:yes gene_type:complete
VSQSTRRQKAERSGRIAEWFALIWLTAKGYRILTRRQKTGMGELDLVCVRGKVVVIVEVKQRRSFDSARTAVSEAAWQRIGRAAELWLSKRGPLANADRRYDLFIFAGNFRFRHIPDAWRPEYPLTHG